MFKAMIMLCMIGTSDQCIILEDVEGPYLTKSKCIERAYEMAADLKSWNPNYKAKKYKCLRDNFEDLKGKIRL